MVSIGLHSRTTTNSILNCLGIIANHRTASLLETHLERTLSSVTHLPFLISQHQSVCNQVLHRPRRISLRKSIRSRRRRLCLGKIDQSCSTVTLSGMLSIRERFEEQQLMHITGIVYKHVLRSKMASLILTFFAKTCRRRQSVQRQEPWSTNQISTMS